MQTLFIVLPCILRALLVPQAWIQLPGDDYAPPLGSASRDLCSALAAIGRHLCSSLVNPQSISALVACRLIRLNKCPRVRPIGVGEVPRRIVAKAILRIIGKDVEEAAGPLQVCAGQDGGCEAAVHAMWSIFQDADTEGCPLVDASNSINRKAALHNVSILCQPLSPILINTYRAPVEKYHLLKAPLKGIPLQWPCTLLP